MGAKISIEALSMKIKAELRVGNIKNLSETMNTIKTHEEFNDKVYGMDVAAYNLFLSLLSLGGAEK